MRAGSPRKLRGEEDQQFTVVRHFSRIQSGPVLVRHSVKGDRGETGCSLGLARKPAGVHTTTSRAHIPTPECQFASQVYHPTPAEEANPRSPLDTGKREYGGSQPCGETDLAKERSSSSRGACLGEWQRAVGRGEGCTRTSSKGSPCRKIAPSGSVGSWHARVHVRLVACGGLQHGGGGGVESNDGRGEGAWEKTNAGKMSAKG